MLNILGLGGSLNPFSTSLAALKVALKGAEEAGAETELLDLRTLNLPYYDPNAVTPPDSAAHLAEAVRKADGLIWSSPLYHGTISGFFKNAIDWLEILSDDALPYLTGKPVGLISTAGGAQGLQAINTMDFIVRALRGWVVPLAVPISQSWRSVADGKLNNPKVEAQLKALGMEVAAIALRFGDRDFGK